MSNQFPNIESTKDFTIRKLEEDKKKLRAIVITLNKKIQDLEQKESRIENELNIAFETIQYLRQTNPPENIQKIKYHTMCEIDQEETIKNEYINYLEEKLKQIEKYHKSV